VVFNEEGNFMIGLESVITQALYADAVDPLQSTCQLPTYIWAIYKSAAFCSSCEGSPDEAVVTPCHGEVLQTHEENYYLNAFEGTNLDLGSINDPKEPLFSMLRNTTYNVSLGQGALCAFPNEF
jgi:hypothetical protein